MAIKYAAGSPDSLGTSQENRSIMSDHSNIINDLENWAKMWDKAQEEGVFKSSPKPAESRPGPDFFGQSHVDADSSLDDAEASYWNQVYKQSVGDITDIGTLNEEEDKDRYKAQDKLGKAYNPVHVDSIGKDQEGEDGHVRVTDNFSDGDKLRELNDLKIRLEKLESKFNAEWGAKGRENKSTEKQIKSIRRQIDELSDNLFPGKYDTDPT